ncbi:class I SAM-dependent methyltransferase, partial [Magnetococcales bacterium HHB-1]
MCDETSIKLAEQHRQWQKKPILRMIYTDLYRRLAQFRVAGEILEIGGGSGNFKAFAPQTLSSDIIALPWLDLVTDAQQLAFAAQSLSNLVLFDVLHHIERPGLFFAEAIRVLRPGGRILLVEPGITPVSTMFYRYFHPEDVDFSQDPLSTHPIRGKKAFDANQAFPEMLFKRQHERFKQQFPELSMIHCQRYSLFAYPLSGGFRKWGLIPAKWGEGLLKLE